MLRTDKKENEVVSTISDGTIFGEIALLTKLKRTATVRSSDYTSCAYISRVDVKMMEENFPHIVQQIREKIKGYSDAKMQFRRLMIRNLHYLSKLNDEIVNELICCMEVKRYAKGSIILKSGDVSSVTNDIFKEHLENKLCEARRNRRVGE